MRYSLGLIVLDGINMILPAGTLPRLVPTEDSTDTGRYLGICVLLYGIGQIIGGYLGGKLCDKYKIRKTVLAILILFCFCCFASVVTVQYIQALWAAGFCYFCWGLEMAGLMSTLMVICSRIYDGDAVSFAIVRQFHSFAAVIYLSTMAITKNSIGVPYIMGGLLILSGGGFWGMLKLPCERN